jgi:hypothetical protein
VHDRTGTGAVNLVSAVIRVLDRQPAAMVLTAEAPGPAYHFGPKQRAALRQLAQAVGGTPEPGNPYRSLTSQR